MNFQEFANRAVTVLVASQLEDGSWLNDEPTTCAVMEALIEQTLGPEAVCRHSNVSPIRCGHWPFMFSSYGLRQQDDTRSTVAAIFKGYMSYRRRQYENPHDTNGLWADAKWLTIGSLVDYDARAWIPLAREQISYSELPPWLAAQVALSVLHNDPTYLPSKDKVFEEKAPILDAVEYLLNCSTGDHWSGPPISDEECTAIVCQFLFHRCIRNLLCNLRHDDISDRASTLLARLHDQRQSALDWLISQQDDGGVWAASPHVTSHCIRFFLQMLSDSDKEISGEETILQNKDRILTTMELAIRHLLGKETLQSWEKFYSYHQVEIFTTLMRAANDPGLHGMFEVEVESLLAVPDVFLSYGSCDREFAKWLARGIEDEGLKVWFAEWDIEYGMDVVEEIEGALSAVTSVLVIVSPESLQRPWVKKEISAALNQAISEGKKRVIPVMFKASPLPIFLRTLKWADFTDQNTHSASRAALIATLKGKRPPRR